MQAKLEKSIQSSYKTFVAVLNAEDDVIDDNLIKSNFTFAWVLVHHVISTAGNPIQKEHLRDLSEFRERVKSGSKEERELIDLLQSMVKQDVPWRNIFENGNCFRPFDAEHTDHHIPSLEAFFKSESEKKFDLTTAHGAR